MEKCMSCQFYDRKAAKGSAGGAPSWGQCRRSAPLLNPVNAKSYMIEGVWPTVRDDDWCGEWKLLAEALNAPLMSGPHSLTPAPRPAPLTTASSGFAGGAASTATIVTPAVMGRSASD